MNNNNEFSFFIVQTITKPKKGKMTNINTYYDILLCCFYMLVSMNCINTIQAGDISYDYARVASTFLWK